MGLALHKSLGEIRALPYPEFSAWQIFYMLEPWGWENNEYLTAALMALLYNMNRGEGKARKVSEFMRDMETEVLNELQEKPNIEDLPREKVIELIKKDFGI